MKVYWVTPTYGLGVHADIYHNHLGMVMIYACKYGIKFGGCSVTKNQLVWAARNNLVESVLGDSPEDDDYIFWVDSDILLEPDTLPRLLDNKKDIITGVYYQKAPPYWPLIMLKLPFEKREGMHQFLYDYPRGTYKVDAIGFGCVIAKVSIFKKIEKPWFDWKVESGEDIGFCVQAKKHNFEIWADTNAVVSHIGELNIISEKTFTEYRKNNMEKISDDFSIIKEK